MYYLYILLCVDSSLYTGIAVDVKKRVVEHNTSHLGAKYTRGRRPVKLVYTKEFPTRSRALKEESRIKKLSRVQKLQLILEPK